MSQTTPSSSPLSSSGQVLRIATRKSPLALWQAEFVKSRLEAFYPDLTVELVTMTTRGDVLLDTPLAKIGGKGLFVKELELAMLEGRADIAVHSMKDVPMGFPDGLGLSVICEREDPTDAFVSNRFMSLDQLPQGARLGTSSLRRQCQLLALYPHLEIVQLRGNVNTRLAKLDEGQYDAIILASAGLKRLGFTDRIAQSVPATVSLPAGGQGAVGIEIRMDDAKTETLIAPLHHAKTARAVLAERAMNRRLEGGCQVPIACFAEETDNGLLLKGLVGSLDGVQLITAEACDDSMSSEELGNAVAEALLAQGAGDILDEVYGQSQE